MRELKARRVALQQEKIVASWPGFAIC